MYKSGTGIIYDSVVDGWERSETENGPFYYINHNSAKTQWDHPWFTKIQEEIDDFNNIKYAAYRAALKLRLLQQKLYLDLIDLRTVNVVFDRHGYRGKNDGSIDCNKLHTVLEDICSTSRIQNSDLGPITIETVAELILNWLLNLYDINRSGHLRVISVKIALGTLCSARISEKYRFFFRELCDSSNYVSRKQMSVFLHEIIQIPEQINEASPFGGVNVAPAVNSCFSTAWNTGGITEDEFTSWLLKDPQPVVWLPTMHRLAAAETVTHEAKCSICKAIPIVGLRYRCLKCFNYDLCQMCFFTGRVSKRHKMKHPTQEYCIASTAKQDTKDFMKIVRNNLSKKHRNKRKLRYLPIRGNQQEYTDEDFPQASDDPGHNEQSMPGLEPQGYGSEGESPQGTEDETDSPQTIQLTRNNPQTIPIVIGTPETTDSGYNETHDILKQLESENRQLLQELSRVQLSSPSPRVTPVVYPAGTLVMAPPTPTHSSQSGSGSEGSEVEWLRDEKERLEAKQEVLESHNKQLELQLYRLRLLLKQDDRLIENNTSTPIFPATAAAPRQAPPPYQATPTGVSLSQSMLLSSGTPSHMLLHKLRTPGTHSQTDSADNIDSTYADKDATLGQTHFSLPSPNHSQYFPDEEAELEKMIDKLNAVYPADMTRSLLESSQDALEDMYSAANKIGRAFSGFVGSLPDEGVSPAVDEDDRDVTPELQEADTDADVCSDNLDSTLQYSTVHNSTQM